MRNVQILSTHKASPSTRAPPRQCSTPKPTIQISTHRRTSLADDDAICQCTLRSRKRISSKRWPRRARCPRVQSLTSRAHERAECRRLGLLLRKLQSVALFEECAYESGIWPWDKVRWVFSSFYEASKIQCTLGISDRDEYQQKPKNRRTHKTYDYYTIHILAPVDASEKPCGFSQRTPRFIFRSKNAQTCNYRLGFCWYDLTTFSVTALVRKKIPTAGLIQTWQLGHISKCCVCGYSAKNMYQNISFVDDASNCQQLLHSTTVEIKKQSAFIWAKTCLRLTKQTATEVRLEGRG